MMMTVMVMVMIILVVLMAMCGRLIALRVRVWGVTKFPEVSEEPKPSPVSLCEKNEEYMMILDYVHHSKSKPYYSR
jgi:Na+-transporting methylmalonyl-CoA/oxaloacetate decarboxylase gamma subunit